MKRFTKFYALAVLTLAISVVSCKKESLSPTLTPGAEAGDAVMDINPVPLDTYPTLTKHGKATLSYYADKKLKSVDLGTGTVTTYTYPAQFPNLITATEKFNNQKVNDITYLLNNDGRCKKMTVKNYWLK